MTWYEILIILLIVTFLGIIIGRYFYKKSKGLPTGECACCQKNKKNALIKAYHRKYK